MTSKNEEEDSLSDAGTYTIEADNPDKELEEARSKIDQASFFFMKSLCLNWKLIITWYSKNNDSPSPSESKTQMLLNPTSFHLCIHPLALLCSWQVFGVFESPERTDQTEAQTSSEFRPVIDQSREQHRQTSCGEVRPAPEQGLSLVKVNLPAQGVISDWVESLIVPQI